MDDFANKKSGSGICCRNFGGFGIGGEVFGPGGGAGLGGGSAFERCGEVINFVFLRETSCQKEEVGQKTRAVLAMSGRSAAW